MNYYEKSKKNHKCGIFIAIYILQVPIEKMLYIKNKFFVLFEKLAVKCIPNKLGKIFPSSYTKNLIQLDEVN